MATAIAVTLAVSPPNTLIEVQNSEASAVHLVSAGIIGTALALVLTLSIIPAQKAADVFSSAILRLYSRDRRFLAVFVSLSFLALISVLFGTGWTFQISARYTLAAQIVALGVAFDALRVFYARALDLLLPATAVSLVEKECDRVIAGTKREIERLVRIYRLSHKNDPRGEKDSMPRWLFYSRSQISHRLNLWNDHLEEFAIKAVDRQDTLAAKAIITSMTAIGTKYADSRRDSLVLLPNLSGPMPTGESDIKNVLDPIYESLKRICDDAIKHPNEAVVISCLRAFGEFAVHASTIVHIQDGRPSAAPLAHSPTFYLDICTKWASTAGMDDALLSSIRGIEQFFGNISVAVDTQVAEATALNCLFDIAADSYPRQAIVPCFRAVEMTLLAARKELQARGLRPASIFGDVLRRIVPLVPLETRMDNAGKRTLQTFPPYDMGFAANIPALLAEVANRVEPVDPDREWIDPFHEFAEASEKVVHHYRDVANQATFDGALLRKWIVDSVLTAANVHVHLLANPPVGGEPFLETVDNRLTWFIYTTPRFFQETTSFPSHHADEAAGGTAILGLKLLKLQRLEAAKACGEAIAHIGRSCAAAAGGSPYETADILLKLEQLARAATALGYVELAEEFRLFANPETLSEETLPGYAEAIHTRIRQLDDELARDDAFALPNDPVPLLRQILSVG